MGGFALWWSCIKERLLVTHDIPPELLKHLNAYIVRYMKMKLWKNLPSMSTSKIQITSLVQKFWQCELEVLKISQFWKGVKGLLLMESTFFKGLHFTDCVFRGCISELLNLSKGSQYRGQYSTVNCAVQYSTVQYRWKFNTGHSHLATDGIWKYNYDNIAF